MNKVKRKTGFIGTLGVSGSSNDKPKENESKQIARINHASSHTTPDAADIQKAIADMQSNGYENIIMEVSSIGLDQNRVNNIQILIHQSDYYFRPLYQSTL